MNLEELYAALFSFEKGSGTKRATQNPVVEEHVSYTTARKRRFRNAILACVLRKNFQNGIPVRSITKTEILQWYSVLNIQYPKPQNPSPHHTGQNPS
jgi:hypothetical protein